MINPIFVFALRHIVLIAFLLTGCDLEANDASHATLTYTEDARAAYNEAMASFRDQEWETAKSLFQEVKRLFPYSQYAKLAELRIADIDFEQGNYTDSISSYRDFAINHRSDRDVEYARYQTARALFLDIDDTVLLPPQEERDQATVLDAYKELRSFRKEFPHSIQNAQVEFMFQSVAGRLARHELYVARYYLRTDQFEAAIARCNYVLQNYKGSGLEPETLVLKGETLMKMKKREDAKRVFETIVNDFGGPFATTAKAFLAEMKSP